MKSKLPPSNFELSDSCSNREGYIIHLFGSRMSIKLILEDEDDFEILEAAIKKVKKILKAKLP